MRIALAEKQIDFELIIEVPWRETTITPQYNPLEKLPMLILDDGSSVYESRHILEFLELKYPETPLLPSDADGILAAHKLEVLCDSMCDALVLIFFERMREAPSEEWIAHQRRKPDGGRGEMARLVGGREWAVGDRFGLGDIAVGTALGYLSVRFSELDWRPVYPNLADFSDRLEARPSFERTYPYPQDITEKVV